LTVVFKPGFSGAVEIKHGDPFGSLNPPWAGILYQGTAFRRAATGSCAYQSRAAEAAVVRHHSRYG